MFYQVDFRSYFEANMAGFLKPLKGFVRKEITDQFLCEILQPWRFLAKHFLTTKTAAKRTERVFQVFFI